MMTARELRIHLAEAHVVVTRGLSNDQMLIIHADAHAAGANHDHDGGPGAPPSAATSGGAWRSRVVDHLHRTSGSSPAGGPVQGGA